MIDLCVKAGVVDKSVSWFSFQDQRIGQGRENAKQFLRDNPDVSSKIEQLVRANAGLVAENMMSGPEDEEEAAAEYDGD